MALVLAYFRLEKGRATFSRPETIVASFLHLMVLSFKAIFNRTSKRQFVVFFCRTPLVDFSQQFVSLILISYHVGTLLQSVLLKGNLFGGPFV